MTDECEVEVDDVKLMLRRHKPDDQLRRFEAAEALRALGYPISYDTLSAMVTWRNGPPFTSSGNSPSTGTASLSRGRRRG